jgi:hypothetical protein
MNCTTARGHLPLYIYGDLEAEARKPLEEHLAGCESCRREAAALKGVTRLLDAVPGKPAATIDLPRLYQEAARRQMRQLRRWKILAGTVAAAAASIAILVIGTRLELQCEPQQIVVRWGEPVVRQSEPPLAPATADPSSLALASAERSQLLNELITAVADNMQSLEHRERRDAGNLEGRLDALQQENARRFVALERAVDALYLLSHKGAE